MALNIKNDEAHALARELAEATGETLTDAVTTALEERLHRIAVADERALLRAEIAEIQAFVRSLPVLDSGRDDELLGYDESGLPS